MENELNFDGRVKNEEIYDIAATFRSAIMKAKNDRRFKAGDRMNGFPGGCCDDACDLLAYYLYDIYGIYTQQGVGTYRDKNPYNTTNHTWLVMENGIIIDITGSQFESCAGFGVLVYVGMENFFYKGLDSKRIYENYDITKSSRLWEDYQIITEYISKEIL